MTSYLSTLLESINDRFGANDVPEDDDVVDELDEDNTSSAVVGYETPNAFGEKKRKDSVYSQPVPKTDRFYKNIGEAIDRIDFRVNNKKNISELNYPDFKTDQSKTDRQKININIKDINKRLSEVEQMINHASKLKLETGSDNTIFWKGTVDRFTKINEKLLRLSSKIREMTA